MIGRSERARHGRVHLPGFHAETVPDANAEDLAKVADPYRSGVSATNYFWHVLTRLLATTGCADNQNLSGGVEVGDGPVPGR